jgi:hypothetical protein
VTTWTFRFVAVIVALGATPFVAGSSAVAGSTAAAMSLGKCWAVASPVWSNVRAQGLESVVIACAIPSCLMLVIPMLIRKSIRELRVTRPSSWTLAATAARVGKKHKPGGHLQT